MNTEGGFRGLAEHMIDKRREKETEVPAEWKSQGGAEGARDRAPRWSDKKRPSDLRIELLADHLEALPVLEAWFNEQWPSHYGPNGPGDVRRDLLSYANRNCLPLAVVAFSDQELCGVAALTSQSVTTHPHFLPWIAAGYVSPRFRRRGIGGEMLSVLEATAKRMGFGIVYCGTSTAARLLQRHGWHRIEQTQYNGHDLAIFKKHLDQALEPTVSSR